MTAPSSPKTAPGNVKVGLRKWGGGSYVSNNPHKPPYVSCAQFHVDKGLPRVSYTCCKGSTPPFGGI